MSKRSVRTAEEPPAYLNKPISDRQRIYYACAIKQILQNHPDLSAQEKTAIQELFNDRTVKNKLKLSERRPRESRLAHGVRTFGENKKLKQVVLTTVNQLLKTGNLIRQWSSLNLPDRIINVSK